VRPVRRISTVVAMLAGALAGGTLILRTSLPTALAVTAVLLALVTMGFAALLRDAERSSRVPGSVQPTHSG
jgi:uncharacterized membrane protein YoaK (UPF0700 family)